MSANNREDLLDDGTEFVTNKTMLRPGLRRSRGCDRRALKSDGASVKHSNTCRHMAQVWPLLRKALMVCVYLHVYSATFALPEPQRVADDSYSFHQH